MCIYTYIYEKKDPKNALTQTYFKIQLRKIYFPTSYGFSSRKSSRKSSLGKSWESLSQENNAEGEKATHKQYVSTAVTDAA